MMRAHVKLDRLQPSLIHVGLAGRMGIGREKSSEQTVSSAGSRGVNPDRDAPGGPVKMLVAVSVTAAEIAEFRKGITS